MKYDFGPEQMCIPLNKGKFATVDAADAQLLVGRYWYANAMGSKWYVTGRKINNPFDKSLVLMHRLFLGFPESEIDHINGCPLINRRGNLRLCKRGQNVSNNVSGIGQTGYRGVLKKSLPRGVRFHARIVHDGKLIHCGSFATSVEAAVARDNFARRLHGEFGVYNFPLPGERSALTGEFAPIEEKQSA